ncbi:MAG: hypothetical protein R2729_06650 [Bryobacteraceae bacterium]
MDSSYENRDETRCRYCGGKLSLLQRISRQEFCSPEHRQAFQREQEELALARLQMALEPKTAPPLTPAEGEPVVEEVPEAAPGTGFAEPEPEPEPAPEPVEEAFEIPESTELLVVAPSPVAAQTPHAESDPEETMAGEVAYPSLAPRVLARSWAPIGGSLTLHGLVNPSAGDLLTIFVVPPTEELAQTPFRLPAVALESDDWDEIAAREQVRRSEPPMAGLVPLKGPQTLRLLMTPTRPGAEPETPLAPPTTSVSTRNLARPAGPKMGGVRALRTRIGSAGALAPMTGGSDEPLEVKGPVSPAMPRLGGVTGGLGEKAAAPGEKTIATGDASGAGRDLSMDSSQIPEAGYCSLGGGPLDQEAAPRLCPPGFPPYDLAAVRAMLGAGIHDASVVWRPVSARPMEAAAIRREDADEWAGSGEVARPGTLFGTDTGALPSGGPIPGHQVIGLVAAHRMDPRRRPAGEGPEGRAEMPAPRPASVAIAAPTLQEARCVRGVVAREGARGPSRDATSLEAVFEGRPGVWTPSGRRAAVPVLSFVGVVAVDPGAGMAGPRESADVELGLEAGQAAARMPMPPGAPGGGCLARVPEPRDRMRWPARPKDSPAAPDLQTIACSFASGGGLWDSLT